MYLDRPFDLNEGQRCLLDLCIGMAIEKFQDHVKYLETENTQPRLALQFRNQIEDAQLMRDRLSNATEITIGSEVPAEVIS